MIPDVSNNHLDGEYGLTNKIRDAMQEVANQFIYIGFLLKEADEYGYYREGGYDNIYDYCEENFGFGRSSTNNFIRVYRQFGSSSGIGLLDSYKAYSYSQLTEMCSMNTTQLNECNPYMTVRELRAVKRGTSKLKLEYSIEPDDPTKVEPEIVQTSGQFFIHHLQALEAYFRNRFMNSSHIEFLSIDNLSSFVKNSGCDFELPVYGYGVGKISLFCYPEHIEIIVNKDKGIIPYFIAFFVYRSLFNSYFKNSCTIEPDYDFEDMGKCSNCGCLCAYEDNFCSDCGFRINKDNLKGVNLNES